MTSHVNRRRFLIGGGAAAAVGLLGAAPAAAEPHRPGTDQHRPDPRVPRLIRQWARAWETGDAELMASLFTSDGSYTDHAFQATFRGREGIAQWVVITLDSIADPRAAITDVVRGSDRAAVRWTFTGTFITQDPFAPVADVRGRSFSVPAVSWFTFSRGRISTVEDYYNLADLMRQLGLPLPYNPPQT